MNTQYHMKNVGLRRNKHIINIQIQTNWVVGVRDKTSMLNDVMVVRCANYCDMILEMNGGGRILRKSYFSLMYTKTGSKVHIILIYCTGEILRADLEQIYANGTLK